MTECFDAGRQKLTFAFTVGALYVLAGILQALAGAGLLSLPLLPGSIMGAFVLMVIGSVFLFGHGELANAHPEGQAFIMVGILLSLMFGVLYLLVLGANALSAHVLKSENFEDWTLLDSLRPELYLSILSLFGHLKWRDEFTADEGIPLRTREGTSPPPLPDPVTTTDEESNAGFPAGRELVHGIKPTSKTTSEPTPHPETEPGENRDRRDSGPEPLHRPKTQPVDTGDRWGVEPAQSADPETEPREKGERRGTNDP